MEQSGKYPTEPRIHDLHHEVARFTMTVKQHLLFL